MGDDNRLRSMAEEIMGSSKGLERVEVVGLNMEDDMEATFDGAVDMAWNLLGMVDAFVNCCVFEGKINKPCLIGKSKSTYLSMSVF